MNIVREDRKDRTVLVKATVTQDDYAQAVEKTLREYKRKANIPGFRPGMVPMGVVNKMYRKGVTAEEAYKTASQAAFNYIDQEKIDYVGDVMPSDDQADLDFEKGTEFEFVFELGLAPAVEIEFTPKDKLTRHTIKADKKMYEGYRSNFLRRFGKLVDVDKVVKEEALEVTLDNEEMNVKDAYVGLISMDDAARKPFIGKKVGDTMDVDVNELYKTLSQRAAVLQVKEDELGGINPKFKLTITRIRQFQDPEMNGEFFKAAFPGGEVTDEKGLETFIYEQIARELGGETDYLFTIQLRKMLLGKAALEMPEDFLKRWLFKINEGKFTMDQIEQDFPSFVDMMRWNLILRYFTEKLELKVTEEEMMSSARARAAAQFAQYGMGQVPDELLDNYARQMLSNREEERKMFEGLTERKMVEAVTPMINVTDKEVGVEEFQKIAEELAK